MSCLGGYYNYYYDYFDVCLFEYFSCHVGIIGDPLDENVVLQLLEPAPPLALSKDFMIKTRRRKGLNEHVTIHKYIDDALLLHQITQNQAVNNNSHMEE